MSIKTAFEFSDLQGIFRYAHARLSVARFLLLKIQDSTAAKQWLAAAPVATAESSSPIPDTALQVAFTVTGLRKLGLREHIIAGFSEEFLSGMTGGNRSRRLGDTGNNTPKYWHWGGDKNSTPDILLMLYASTDEIEPWQQQITGEQFDQAFIVQSRLTTNDRIDQEPFGFADGISQPNIDWNREQSTNLHRRNKYSNLLAPGEIILGYPNEYGEYTDRPLLDTKNDSPANILPSAEDNPELKDLGRNGSYLIFRQLQQDVPGFWQFVDQATNSDPQNREQLAEAMVGRKRNGTPLVPIANTHIPGIKEKNRGKNNFNFDTDLEGQICPVGAHVRRSNPRTGDFPSDVNSLFSRFIRILGFGGGRHQQDLVASTRFHRILRRGRQYGSELKPEDAISAMANQEERGLQFICLSANIARQFEFVQNAWIANGKFDGLQNEQDPLLGNRQSLDNGSSTDNFSRPQSAGPRKSISGIPQFVTVRGGAYFFLPGIRALKYITNLSTPPQGRK